MQANKGKIWCVVPAAGLGKRMRTNTPKQYLAFQSTTLLEFTLARLLDCQKIDQLVVALHASDTHWKNTIFSNHPNVMTVEGGDERASSVLHALQRIKSLTHVDDWVLVHDAARPCVLPSDIKLLIQAAQGSLSGALLATPITDTVKQASGKRVDTTLNREHLWRALTPQLFRLTALEKALSSALQNKQDVTDEASAIEFVGGQPLLVKGRADNIKITTAADIPLANFIIEQQELTACV